MTRTRPDFRPDPRVARAGLRIVGGTDPRAWKRVIFIAELDEDDNCPVCNVFYADCPCPGPTMEDHDYVTDDEGVLWARPMEDEP